MYHLISPQLVAMQKAAEAALVSNTPAPPMTRSAVTSGVLTPGFGYGSHLEASSVKPPKKKPGPKPKPYARVSPRSTPTPLTLTHADAALDLLARSSALDVLSQDEP